MQHAAASAAAPVSSRLTAQRSVVWVLFLFSGICGLIYEVLWCRHLGLLFGNTVQSMSAVLTAFMAGLALGSYLGGRICHRLKRPMMVYGLLEIAIGVYCAFLPWAFGSESPIIPFYRNLYGEAGGGAGLSIARFVISFFLLLIPTTFMGATLPILAQFLVRSKAYLGRIVGALYAINTFGAVLGAALTGFVLLPVLGKAFSNNVAVTANLILGILAVIVGMSEESPMNVLPETDTREEDDSQSKHGSGGQAPIPPLALKIAIVSFGITGFAAMATQIGWTRAISLATGSSTYAFSLIVAVFIMGLSLGGVWGARAAARTPDPLALLGKLLLAIGLCCMALTAILEFGPKIFLFLTIWGSDMGWTWQLVLQAVGIALLIIGPTFLMGATMPLTMQVAAKTEGAPGRTVGTIYAVNTIGSILGSFLGGLLLLPKLHIQGTLQLMALLYAAPGLVLFFMSKAGRDKKPRADFMIAILAGVTVVGVLAYSLAKPWDRLTMSSGMYLLRNKALLDNVRGGRWADAFFVDLSRDNRLVYYNEGAAATVAVNEVKRPSIGFKGALTRFFHPIELSLTVGGKPDASSHRDMSTQLGLALVPVLFHEKGPETVLVVGLGSGASAAAALAPDSVKSVDVVEMSPEVVEASYYFSPYTKLQFKERENNKGVYWLDTPRLNLIVNDGRNHLLLTSKKYDVIASEPSNPWLAGVGNLFTKEAFALCRSHLNPGGVMCQWIHCYSLEEADFFNIVHTFGEVFPHVELWCVNRLDFLLIGSDAPSRLPIAALQKRMNQKNVFPMLQSIRFDTVEELVACFMSGDAELRDISRKAGAKLHTDDNMMLEFSAPKALYHPTQQLRSTTFEPDPELAVDLAALTSEPRGEMEAKLDIAAAARDHLRCAFDAGGMPSAMDHKIIARVLAPNQLWVQEEQREIEAAALQKISEGKPQEIKPEGLQRAREFAEAGQVEKAIAELQTLSAELTAQGKRTYDCIETAVQILRDAGKAEDALVTLDAVLRGEGVRADPASYKLWALAAEMMEERKQPKKAMDLAGTAEGLASQATGKPLGIAGRILLAQKRFGPAYDELHHLTILDPQNTDLKLYLCDALIGMASEAAEKSDKQQTLTKLHHARRLAREVSPLNDDPAWLRLSQTQLLLANYDKESSVHHRSQALASWEKLFGLDKLGNLIRLSAQTDTVAAARKARLDRAVRTLAETYKTDADSFLRFHATMLKIKAH